MIRAAPFRVDWQACPGVRLAAAANDRCGAFLGEALRGQVWVLNVWASWCESCRDEHALLVEFARRNIAPIYGLDYKDEPEAARSGSRERAILTLRRSSTGRGGRVSITACTACPRPS